MNEILTQEKSIYLQIAEMIETDIFEGYSSGGRACAEYQ